MGISVKIKGNKFASDGVGVELVAIGDTRFPVLDQQYSGAGRITDIIIVRHLTDKSVYSLMTKNVTPADSSRNGTLIVSVSVPAGEQVTGLFNLLIELSGAYKNNFMTFDGSMYHFTDKREQPTLFESIIERYNVTRYPYKPVRMTVDVDSIAYLFMTPTQIPEVLDDPMRREFAGYGQIVLVPVPDPAVCQSTFSMPSKIVRTYKIFVNGRQTAQTLSDPTKNVTITIGETSTTEAATATFTLAAAQSQNAPGIVVDDYNQVIHVKLQPKKKIIALSADEPSGTSRKPRKRSILPYILVGIIVSAAIAGACYFLGLFGGNSEPQQSDATEATVEEDRISDETARKYDEFREEIEEEEEETDRNKEKTDNGTDKPESVADNKKGNNGTDNAATDGSKKDNVTPKKDPKPSAPAIPAELQQQYDLTRSQLQSTDITYKQLAAAKKFIENNTAKLGDAVKPLKNAVNAHEGLINTLSSKETIESYRKSARKAAKNYSNTIPEIAKYIEKNTADAVPDSDVDTFRLKIQRNAEKKSGKIY